MIGSRPRAAVSQQSTAARPELSKTVALHAAAFLAVIASGCERPIEGKSGLAAKPVTRVEVVHPEQQTVRRTVSEPAQVQAFETTELHAKISGFVTRWTVNIGDLVKKGQVLAELSVPELRAEMQQKNAAVEQDVAKHALAKAAVAVAEANMAGAAAKLTEVRAGVRRVDADLERWQSEYKRVEELFRARAQTGSLVDETRSKLHSAEAAREEIAAQVRTAEVALTQAQAARDEARAEVAAAAAAIQVAREDARRIDAMVAYTKIEAPFDGIITHRHVDTGELTKPGADSVPLFVVARSDVLTIAADIPEMFAAEVTPGDRATVAIQAMKDTPLECTITRTAWALDPKTRTLRVEIDVPNPAARLRPGLYAYATVVVEEHANALTVPASAIVRANDRTSCVIVVDGKAVPRDVELGLSDGTRTEVVSGLAADDAVVKANAASLVDRQPLDVMAPPRPTAAAKP